MYICWSVLRVHWKELRPARQFEKIKVSLRCPPLLLVSQNFTSAIVVLCCATRIGPSPRPAKQHKLSSIFFNLIVDKFCKKKISNVEWGKFNFILFWKDQTRDFRQSSSKDLSKRRKSGEEEKQVSNGQRIELGKQVSWYVSLLWGMVKCMISKMIKPTP